MFRINATIDYSDPKPILLRAHLTPFLIFILIGGNFKYQHIYGVRSKIFRIISLTPSPQILARSAIIVHLDSSAAQLSCKIENKLEQLVVG